MRAYEGLFLVDEGKAAEVFQEVADHIRGLLEKHGASVQKLEKWNSGRLAYEIDGKKRGTYILTHFQADPAQIAELRRDCQLSSTIMRALILRQENVGESLEAAEQARRQTEEARGEQPAPQGEPAEQTAHGEEEPESDIIGDAGELEEGQA